MLEFNFKTRNEWHEIMTIEEFRQIQSSLKHGEDFIFSKRAVGLKDEELAVFVNPQGDKIVICPKPLTMPVPISKLLTL